jgi:CubicO group peptidase (beta-lactamase class C family)
MFQKRWTAVIGLFLCFILSGVGISAQQVYYPTDTWRTSTPEEQGMDSAKLAEMFRQIQNDDVQIRSVLVIRHGYLVAECYRKPYDKDTAVNVKSVTKSFLSALTGIAIRENFIASLDQKVAELLPEYFGSGTDPGKTEITLKHLLTMTSGLQFNNDDQIDEWVRSKDWGASNCQIRSKPGCGRETLW